MRRNHAIAFFAIVSFAACSTALRAAPKSQSGRPTPAGLVQAALESELEGAGDKRQSLLAEALKLDPNFAPARWQSGFVNWNGEWLLPEQVAKRSASDEQLTAYRHKRDGLIDTADNQRALAKWCRKNKLPAEERIHWAKVLEFDANDAEALAALGLQLYDGRLLTRPQIEQEKSRERDQLRAMQHWRPLIMKWRQHIEEGDDRKSTKASESILAVRDPTAIHALEAVLAGDSARDNSKLQELLIEVIGTMPDPAATQVLLRMAIVPNSEGVRISAIDELRKRPMFAYVPQLIASFPPSVDVHVTLHALPGGALVRQSELKIDSRESEFYIADEALLVPTPVPPFRSEAAYVRNVRRWQALELLNAQNLNATGAALQQQNNRIMDRIRFVLHRATGFENVNDPGLWERQWNDYNGWYNSPYPEKKYQATAQSSLFVVPLMGSSSCFPPGTLVTTLTGARNIESIRPGDRVLSQNLETGELSFQSVVRTTLRPSMPLVKIGLGSEEIVATRGHPFWVVGRGWRVAKFLQLGDQLHGIEGGVPIDELGEVAPQEVYNLVLSDRHTYFVGKQQLLVHDNSPLADTASLLPGLFAQHPDPKLPVQRAAQ